MAAASGCYHTYNLTHIVYEFSAWCEITALLKCIQKLQRLEDCNRFSASEATKIYTELKNGCGTQIFGSRKRFPEDGWYVCCDYGGWALKFQNLANTCRGYRNLQPNLTSLRCSIVSAMEVYNRITFEKAFGLVWTTNQISPNYI